MSRNPWAGLGAATQETDTADWLSLNLAANAKTAYLRQFGSPRDQAAFRRQVPTCAYEDLLPYLDRLRAGESDVLFRGRPVAYERTGGSSGGTKLIPYSAAGLADFRRSILPWLTRTLRGFAIVGRAYFAISPATRPTEVIGGVPVGLPDAVYLGEQAGAILAERSAVSPSVAAITDVESWRHETVAQLSAAEDLELISVWSPTFLLRLLERIPDAAARWPRLKLISCWAGGASARYLPELRARLPQAAIQPKGLLSIEAVVTVPGEDGRALLTGHGFVEFADGERLLLDRELELGREYGVVVTTASGLYRYRTGDRVRFDGRTGSGRGIVEFIGRDSTNSDLVGEKLTEAFAARCLADIAGFAMLVPDPDGRKDLASEKSPLPHGGDSPGAADASRPRYVLICEQPPSPGQVEAVERNLQANPQYAYARKLGQLASLHLLVRPLALSIVERAMVERGARLGDIKPVALRTEPFWLSLFEAYQP